MRHGLTGVRVVVVRHGVALEALAVLFLFGVLKFFLKMNGQCDWLRKFWAVAMLSLKTRDL